jgi:hypothetical protein
MKSTSIKENLFIFLNSFVPCFLSYIIIAEVKSLVRKFIHWDIHNLLADLLVCYLVKLDDFYLEAKQLIYRKGDAFLTFTRMFCFLEQLNIFQMSLNGN